MPNTSTRLPALNRPRRTACRAMAPSPQKAASSKATLSGAGATRVQGTDSRGGVAGVRPAVAADPLPGLEAAAGLRADAGHNARRRIPQRTGALGPLAHGTDLARLRAG